MMTVITNAAIGLYLSATLLRLYVSNTRWLSRQQWLLMFGGIAVCLHAVVLYDSMMLVQGMNFGIFDAASLIAWVVCVMLLLILPTQPVDNLVVILFPVSALAIAVEFFIPHQRLVSTTGQTGVELHVFTAILAYSFLTVSALQSVLLAYQDYQLRHKRLRWVLRKMPPMQLLEQLSFQTLWLGFIFLTVSLFAGFIFLDDLFAQHLAHKTILSLIAWGVFAGLLWGRWRYGWRGRVAMRWNLSGFACLLLAYFGSKFVLEIVLQRV